MKLLATSSKRKGGINACAGFADGAFADLLHKHGPAGQPQSDVTAKRVRWRSARRYLRAAGSPGATS
jgi:hypothetical protein